MGMGMVMELAAPKRGIEHLPYYEPKAGARKPERVTLVIPHSNEIPAAHPFREALAERLMAEGIDVTTRMETGMVRRTVEARKKINEYVHGRLVEKLGRSEEFWGRFETERTRAEITMFYGQALTRILSMDDYMRRARAIAKCMADGNDLVVELHAMDTDAYFGDDEVDAGFRRITDSGFILAPDAINVINRAFLRGRTKLAEDRNIARVASELAAVIGLDMENIFMKYFRARDRVLHMFGSSTALIEIPSVRTRLPAEYSIVQLYDLNWFRDPSGCSDFENTYCTVVRKSAGFSSEEME